MVNINNIVNRTALILIILSVFTTIVIADPPPGPPTVTNIVVTATPSSINATGTDISIIKANITWTGVSNGTGFSIKFQIISQPGGVSIDPSFNVTTNGNAYATLIAGTNPGPVIVMATFNENASIFNTTTVTLIGEKNPPIVTSPSASPNEILLQEAGNADYAHMTTTLSATVTDPGSGVKSVTIDLSSIGGSAAAVMNPMGGDVYSIATNATGVRGSKSLTINATDNLSNSNTANAISLKVTRNGDVNEDGLVDIADAMWLAKNRVGLPGFPINTLASDVNGDSTVDIADAMYIAKHAVGLPGFENLK